MAGWHGTRALLRDSKEPRFPNAEDVREGLIAYKIAAHAADPVIVLVPAIATMN